MRKTPPRESHLRDRSVEITTDGVKGPPVISRLARFCEQALVAAGFSSWQVSILLCDDKRITALNRRYRRRHETTDVLSFPQEEKGIGEPVAGDIAICLDALRRNAAQFGVPQNEEMKRLLVHGLLHLAGMDHGRGKGKDMLVLQERLLDTFHSENIYWETGK
jgi:probable rRNA maturation factor